MLKLFSLLLTAAISCNLSQQGNTTSSFGGFSNMEISSTVLTRVSFGHLELPIYENQKNPERAISQKTFYTLPLGMIKSELGSCYYNPLSTVWHLAFPVIMWSDDLEATILSSLNKLDNDHTFTSQQVMMLPIEKVRFVWKQISLFTDTIVLDNTWYPYSKNPSQIYVNLMTKNNETCSSVREQLSQQPSIFRDFQLHLALQATRTHRKRLQMTISDIVRTTLFAKLENIADANVGTVYLRSEDIKELSREISQSIIGRVETDAEFVESSDSISLVGLVATFISKQGEFVDSVTLDDDMWDSVFWDPAFARPDKTTKLLNRIFSITDNHSSEFSLKTEELNQYRQTSEGAEVDFLDIVKSKFGLAHTSNDATKKTVAKTELDKWLATNGIMVEWTGERFDVKPMTLRRMNLNTLTSARSFISTSVQVHTVDKTYPIEVSLPQDVYPQEDEALAVHLIRSRVNLNQRIDVNEFILKKMQSKITTINLRIDEHKDQIRTNVQQTSGLRRMILDGQTNNTNRMENHNTVIRKILKQMAYVFWHIFYDNNYKSDGAKTRYKQLGEVLKNFGAL